jgi:hypothetical protein
MLSLLLGGLPSQTGRRVIKNQTFVGHAQLLGPPTPPPPTCIHFIPSTSLSPSPTPYTEPNQWNRFGVRLYVVAAAHASPRNLVETVCSGPIRKYL